MSAQDFLRRQWLGLDYWNVEGFGALRASRAPLETVCVCSVYTYFVGLRLVREQARAVLVARCSELLPTIDSEMGDERRGGSHAPIVLRAAPSASADVPGGSPLPPAPTQSYVKPTPWVYVDFIGSDPYYYNHETGVSVWELPPGAELQQHMEEVNSSEAAAAAAAAEVDTTAGCYNYLDASFLFVGASDAGASTEESLRSPLASADPLGSGLYISAVEAAGAGGWNAASDGAVTPIWGSADEYSAWGAEGGTTGSGSALPHESREKTSGSRVHVPRVPRHMLTMRVDTAAAAALPAASLPATGPSPIPGQSAVAARLAGVVSRSGAAMDLFTGARTAGRLPVSGGTDREGAAAVDGGTLGRRSERLAARDATLPSLLRMAPTAGGAPSPAAPLSQVPVAA